MTDNKYDRIEDENDPLRCQSNNSTGQCEYRVIKLPNGGISKYCPRHTPGKMTRSSNYRFNAQFLPRINELSDNPQLKSLTEEIALMRMTLEVIVNRCKDDLQLTLEADRISKMVGEINKLVVSCHKLEEATGQVLNKTIVVNIGSMMVNILSKYIENKDILDKVGEEIYAAIETSASPTSDVGSIPQLDYQRR